MKKIKSYTADPRRTFERDKKRKDSLAPLPLPLPEMHVRLGAAACDGCGASDGRTLTPCEACQSVSYCS
jgi:hypothetical protein